MSDNLWKKVIMSFAIGIVVTILFIVQQIGIEIEKSEKYNYILFQSKDNKFTHWVSDDRPATNYSYSYIVYKNDAKVIFYGSDIVVRCLKKDTKYWVNRITKGQDNQEGD